MNFSREFKNTAPRLLLLLSGIVTSGLGVIDNVENFSLLHSNLIMSAMIMLPSWIAFFGWDRWPRVVYPRSFTLFVVIGLTLWLTLYALDTNSFTTKSRDTLTYILGVIIILALAIWYIVKAVQVYDLMSHGSVSTIKRFTDKDEGPLTSESSENTENNK